MAARAARVARDSAALQVVAGDQVFEEPAAGGLADLEHVVESARPAVIGVGDFEIRGAARIETSQQLHANPGVVVGGESEQVGEIRFVHREHEIEAREVGGLELSCTTRQFDVPPRRAGSAAGVGRFTDVPRPGAGAVDGDLVAEPFLGHHGEQDALGSGRTADVAETDEADLDHRGSSRRGAGEASNDPSVGPDRAMSRDIDGLGLGAALRRHFGVRQDAFTSALFVFPLFLVYQVGIVAGARGRNGADFVTSALVRLCRSDLGSYLLLLACASALYVGLLLWLRGRRTIHSRLFGPMLFEATVYASLMGALIQLLIVRFDRFVPILALADAGAIDIAVISAGAGLHEELVFRAGLLVLLIRVFALPTIPVGRIGGRLLALLLSSWAFAAVHHLGGGEPFTGLAFVYRTFAGAIFGLIYLYRGFGVAAWTHALYDVLVLSFD